MEQIAAMLRETRGMVYAAAQQLGCSPQTIYNYIERYPTLKQVMEAERGKMVDVAELALYRAIEAGEPWAITLALKTLGRSRGYVERQEMTTPDGQPLRIVVTWQGDEVRDA